MCGTTLARRVRTFKGSTNVLATYKLLDRTKNSIFLIRKIFLARASWISRLGRDVPRCGRRSTHVGQVVSHSRFVYTRGTLGFEFEVSINLAWFYRVAFTTQQHIIKTKISTLSETYTHKIQNIQLLVNPVDTHNLGQEYSSIPCSLS